MSSPFLEALTRSVELEIIKYDILPLLFALYLLSENNTVITYGNFNFIPDLKNKDYTLFWKNDSVFGDNSSQGYFNSQQNDIKCIIALLENTSHLNSNLVSSLIVREGKYKEGIKFAKTKLLKDRALTSLVLTLIRKYNITKNIPPTLALIYLYLFPDKWVKIIENKVSYRGTIHMKIEKNNLVEAEWLYSGQTTKVDPIGLIKRLSYRNDSYYNSLELMEND